MSFRPLCPPLSHCIGGGGGIIITGGHNVSAGDDILANGYRGDIMVGRIYWHETNVLYSSRIAEVSLTKAGVLVRDS